MPQAVPLSLYLHIPFCDHKCSYCDFNSYAGLERMIPAFTDALVNELRAWAPAMRGRRVPTVFFGGGTPSLMTPAQVATILDAARETLDLAPGCEITVEANPGECTVERLAGFRVAGVPF